MKLRWNTGTIPLKKQKSNESSIKNDKNQKVMKSTKIKTGKLNTENT